MNFRLVGLVLLGMTSSVAMDRSSSHPTEAIGNEFAQLRVYLPDAKDGFYTGTRFDWAGVISSLEANGHNYYGPWFDDRDPAIHDFEYQGDRIVAGAASAITGPVDEFAPLGFEAAKIGGTFIKIGVGALKKTDATKYDNYHAYDIANGGQWTVERHADGIEFAQKLQDASSGYGYVYRKTLQLRKGKAELVLRHTLQNTGRLPIDTDVYNHNFLVLDGKGPQEGAAVSFPFTIGGTQGLHEELATVQGKQLIYHKTLSGKDVVTTPVSGFGQSATDNRIQIEYPSAQAGVSFHCDQPLSKINLWSIRSVQAVEPFIAVHVATGKTLSWTTVYDYYSLPRR